MLNPDIGVEYVYANNPRLFLSHDEVMEQGKMVEEARRAVRNSEDNIARYNELKGATGCRGLSTPISLLEYTDATTFFEYPVAHCMALGLHSQLLKQMRDTLGAEQFNKACRKTDKRSSHILRPSVLKRPIKNMLPDSSLNLLSGYKVEDHQHAMECYHVLAFHQNFTHGLERDLFRCDSLVLDKVYHMYWRFLSCGMFLFRGADKTTAADDASEEHVHAITRVIIDHRLNFEKDVEVFLHVV